MSLARGRFGIEYDPHPRREDSSGAGRVVFAVLLVAAISYAVTAVRRRTAERNDPEPPTPAVRHAATPPSVAQPEPPTDAQPAKQGASAANPAPLPQQADGNDAATAPGHQPAPLPGKAVEPPATDAGGTKRPPRVRNLLLRLKEAEKSGNIPMAVTTIETLRNLPGEPAADLDDALARRLGELNERWLFELGGKQWVDEVQVRAGTSASRIAAAHGSTLASLVRLNGLKDANHLRVGDMVKVMNHPRLSLTVHRRARYADLHLNGKFFRRYDLAGEISGAVGVYTTEANPRPLFKKLGLNFSLNDRTSLETILPKGSSVIVSET